MAEYIERQKVSDACYEIQEEIVRTGRPLMPYLEVNDALLRVEQVIKGAPAADVAPVIHAHWVPKKVMIRSPHARNYSCSHCGYEPIEAVNFCTQCGAHMDEEATNG